jgi:hypothetical protein
MAPHPFFHPSRGHDRRSEKRRAVGGLTPIGERPRESRLNIITRRRILYWLAATVAVVVAGIIIGLIWADTSDVAGFIAVVTNIVGGVGIVILLIALAGATRRQRQAT